MRGTVWGVESELFFKKELFEREGEHVQGQRERISG